MKLKLRILAAATVGAVFFRLKNNPRPETLTQAEYDHLDAALGDALRPNGSTDMDRLKADSRPFDLDARRRVAITPA